MTDSEVKNLINIQVLLNIAMIYALKPHIANVKCLNLMDNTDTKED